MTSLLPLASYNLALEPFVPTQAIQSDLPVTVHITLAALDPEAIDDDDQPSTLRILKSSVFNNLSDDFDEEDLDDEELAALEAAEEDEEDELDDDEEPEVIEAESEDDEEDDEDNEEGDEDDEDEEDSDDEDDVEEYIICTLSPKSQYQQTLDLTIAPDEDVYFVVTGSYPIHISGNYVEHPYENDDFDSEDDSEEDYDSDEYDLTPDEDEIIEEGDFDIEDLDEDEDVESKIEELVEEEEEAKKSKKTKKDKKREAAEEPVKETKKQKKAKDEEKSVQFNKELEQGPTKEKKPIVKTLAGGVVIEDRTVGKGPTAKNGSKVGVRYIGKLKNGSIFDKNTGGKPFQFHLGKGEVIKGWDIGVQGMAVGGERRIVIPAPFAYGKKKLPGIPANSELTFDVKLVTLK